MLDDKAAIRQQITAKLEEITRVDKLEGVLGYVQLIIDFTRKKDST